MDPKSAFQNDLSSEVGTVIFLSIIGAMAHCCGCVLKYSIRRIKPKTKLVKIVKNKNISNSV